MWTAHIDQLCEDAGCCSEDLTGAMNDREVWREISVLIARHEDDDVSVEL